MPSNIKIFKQDITSKGGKEKSKGGEAARKKRRTNLSSSTTVKGEDPALKSKGITSINVV